MIKVYFYIGFCKKKVVYGKMRVIKKKIVCTNRESNPGQVLGRRLCYHYTIGASDFKKFANIFVKHNTFFRTNNS